MLFPFTRPFHCDMLLTLWDRNEGRQKPPCLTSRCLIKSFLAFGLIISRVYSETTTAVDELWASKLVHSDTTDIWIDIKLKLQCDFDLKDDRRSLTRRSLTALNVYNAAIIFPRHNNDDGYNSTNINKQLSPSQNTPALQASWKKVFPLHFQQYNQSKYWKIFLCARMLVLDWKEGAFVEKVYSNVLLIFAFITIHFLGCFHWTVSNLFFYCVTVKNPSRPRPLSSFDTRARWQSP